MSMRAIVCLAVCLWLLLFGGCDFPGRPNPADRPVAPENVLKFGTLFQVNCSGCHGADGTLGGAPPIHDDLFRAIISKDELERTIADGRPGTPMPAFAIENGGTLSPAQVQVLVHEIKGIRYKTVETFEPAGKKVDVVEDAHGEAPQWGLPQPPPSNTPPYAVARSTPQLSNDEADRIREATFAAACASCHGDHGQGGKTVGAINGHAFLSLSSDQVLRRFIITGRPDLKMPDFAGAQRRPPGFQPLKSQEISELVALLRYWQQVGAVPGEGNNLKADTADSPGTDNLKADVDGKSS